MTFTPGTPKPLGSGRQKGTPNKRTKEMRMIHDIITKTALNHAHKLDEYLNILDRYSGASKSANVLMRLIHMSLSKAPPSLDQDSDEPSLDDQQDAGVDDAYSESGIK